MEGLFEFLFEIIGEVVAEIYIDFYIKLFSAIFPKHRERKWIEIVGAIIGLLMFIGILALCIWGIAFFVKRQFLKGFIVIVGAILIFVIHVLISVRLRRRNM